MRSLAIACVSLLLLSCGTQGLPPVALVPAPSDDPWAAPQGAAGMRVYMDPETGAFGVPPPEALPEAALQLQSPSEELVEVPGTTDAGGFTVELNGQFQMDLTVTPDADGKISIRCE